MHQCLTLVLFPPPAPFCPLCCPFFPFFSPGCPFFLSLSVSPVLLFAICFYFLLCFVVFIFVFCRLLRTWYAVSTAMQIPYAILLDMTGTTHTCYEREKTRIKKQNTQKRIRRFSQISARGSVEQRPRDRRCSNSPYNKSDQLQQMVASTNTTHLWNKPAKPFLGRALTIQITSGTSASTVRPRVEVTGMAASRLRQAPSFRVSCGRNDTISVRCGVVML